MVVFFKAQIDQTPPSSFEALLKYKTGLVFVFEKLLEEPSVLQNEAVVNDYKAQQQTLLESIITEMDEQIQSRDFSPTELECEVQMRIKHLRLLFREGETEVLRLRSSKLVSAFTTFVCRLENLRDLVTGEMQGFLIGMCYKLIKFFVETAKDALSCIQLCVQCFAFCRLFTPDCLKPEELLGFGLFILGSFTDTCRVLCLDTTTGMVNSEGLFLVSTDTIENGIRFGKECLERAWQIWKKCHEDIVFIHFHLPWLFFILSRLDNAIEETEACLKTQKELCGPCHCETFAVQMRLADFLILSALPNHHIPINISESDLRNLTVNQTRITQAKKCLEDVKKNMEDTKKSLKDGRGSSSSSGSITGHANNRQTLATLLKEVQGKLGVLSLFETHSAQPLE